MEISERSRLLAKRYWEERKIEDGKLRVPCVKGEDSAYHVVSDMDTIGFKHESVMACSNGFTKPVLTTGLKPIKVKIKMSYNTKGNKEEYATPIDCTVVVLLATAVIVILKLIL